MLLIIFLLASKACYEKYCYSRRIQNSPVLLSFYNEVAGQQLATSLKVTLAQVFSDAFGNIFQNSLFWKIPPENWIYQAKIYQFKVNNKRIRKRCEKVFKFNNNNESFF